ncbi:MAG: hypothetical protein LUI60_05405 [Clostridia bacterium]|nr:hypothetical protein [Clostridia bacterium]
MFITKAYNYYRASLWNNSVSKRAISTFIIVMVIAMMGSSTSDETSTIMSLGTFDILLAICCMVALFMSSNKNGEPVLRNVLPVSRCRRIVYDYVIPLIVSLVYAVIFIAASIVLWLVIALVIWLFSGENPFVYEKTEVAQFILSGELASLFRFVLVYSLCQIIAHTDKNWWIALIVTGVVHLVWTIVPVVIASHGDVTYSFYASFSVLNLGWLYLLISGIVSALVLIFSLMYVYNYYKPKDY